MDGGGGISAGQSANKGGEELGQEQGLQTKMPRESSIQKFAEGKLLI